MELADLISGRSEHSGSGWTTFAKWYSDADRMVGVACEGKEPHAWKLLAFGLEYRKRTGSRALTLVLPPSAAEATANRAALLRPPIDIYVVSPSEMKPVRIPPLEKAVSWFGGLGGVTTREGHDTDGWPDWLLNLADYVETRTVIRERSSNRHLWQFRGRQILEIAPSGGGGWRVTAGKNYSTPVDDQPTELSFAREQHPTEKELQALRHAVDTAVENRRTGQDADHPESLMQAAVGLAPEMFGATQLYREFPAWRPQGRAKIDFVGVDEDGHLHAIETKVGADAQLGVQGLDYWGWVSGNATKILAALGVPTPTAARPVTLRFGLGCTEGRLLHEAARATIESLHDEIPWRVHVIRDWDTIKRPGLLLQASLATRLNERVLPPDDLCNE